MTPPNSALYRNTLLETDLVSPQTHILNILHRPPDSDLRLASQTPELGSLETVEESSAVDKARAALPQYSQLLRLDQDPAQAPLSWCTSLCECTILQILVWEIKL